MPQSWSQSPVRLGSASPLLGAARFPGRRVENQGSSLFLKPAHLPRSCPHLESLPSFLRAVSSRSWPWSEHEQVHPALVGMLPRSRPLPATVTKPGTAPEGPLDSSSSESEVTDPTNTLAMTCRDFCRLRVSAGPSVPRYLRMKCAIKPVCLLLTAQEVQCWWCPSGPRCLWAVPARLSVTACPQGLTRPEPSAWHGPCTVDRAGLGLGACSSDTVHPVLTTCPLVLSSRCPRSPQAWMLEGGAVFVAL